jgi:uncharacterized protein YdaU (DUF1376 family)
MKRPWMPFYPADFQLDTLDLKPDEVGVYITMLCLAWKRGDGSVPGDLVELKAILQRMLSGFHGLTFNRIVPKLLARYFELRAGKYYQKRVEKELRKAEEISEKQSRIARERWEKRPRNSEETPTTPNKINNIGDAIASAVVVPLHSHSQLQKKEDAANAAQKSPDAKLFSRGREVLGKEAGGLIKKLLKAKGGNIPLAMAAIEVASTKHDPREYVAGVIHSNSHRDEAGAAQQAGYGDTWW